MLPQFFQLGVSPVLDDTRVVLDHVGSAALDAVAALLDQGARGGGVGRESSEATVRRGEEDPFADLLGTTTDDPDDGFGHVVPEPTDQEVGGRGHAQVRPRDEAGVEVNKNNLLVAGSSGEFLEEERGERGRSPHGVRHAVSLRPGHAQIRQVQGTLGAGPQDADDSRGPRTPEQREEGDEDPHAGVVPHRRDPVQSFPGGVIGRRPEREEALGLDQEVEVGGSRGDLLGGPLGAADRREVTGDDGVEGRAPVQRLDLRDESVQPGGAAPDDVHGGGGRVFEDRLERRKPYP